MDGVFAAGSSIPIAKTQFMEAKYHSQERVNHGSNSSMPPVLAKCPSGGVPANLTNLQSSGLQQVASQARSPATNNLRQSTNLQILQHQ